MNLLGLKINGLAVLVLLFTGFITHIKAQDTLSSISKNIIYTELGGAGGYGSLKFERLLLKKNIAHFGISVGISTYRIIDFENRFNPDIILPISLSGYYGKNHHFEFSISQIFSSIVLSGNSDLTATRGNSISGGLDIGYRYQQESGGVFFRITYSPIFEGYNYFRHWGGLAAGYAF